MLVASTILSTDQTEENKTKTYTQKQQTKQKQMPCAHTTYGYHFLALQQKPSFNKNCWRIFWEKISKMDHWQTNWQNKF